MCFADVAVDLLLVFAPTGPGCGESKGSGDYRVIIYTPPPYALPSVVVEYFKEKLMVRRFGWLVEYEPHSAIFCGGHNAPFAIV